MVEWESINLREILQYIERDMPEDMSAGYRLDQLISRTFNGNDTDIAI